ncbi:hypothetical protein K9U39_05615 [Rhodoblastus acidophilus]|nr:hypothetical protein [Rhodoblastus acidophilus]
MTTLLLEPSWAASRPEIWFAPAPGHTDPASGNSAGVSDYQKLFDPNADWRRAASNVRLFQFGVNYTRKASDDNFRQAIAFLKQHHIALAIGIGLLPSAAPCPHLEGFDTDQLRIARHIESLGGQIDYVVADAPLLGGYESSPKPGCNQPIDVLARRAAETAKAIRSVFPNVKFVDVEAVSNFKDPNTAKLISDWHAAFASAFGEPFAAFEFDVNWHSLWQARVRSVFAQMRRDHMPVGVICDGSQEDGADAAWLASAQAHCSEFPQAVGSQPDIVIFQSWFPHPTRALPESDPTSFTHLILDYAAHQHH